MRRRSVLPFFLFTALIGALVPLSAGPAAAQTAPSATLTLQQQSAWNGPGRPLNLRLRATNTGGTTLTDLSIAVTIEAPARTRGAYQQAMKSDTTGATGIAGCGSSMVLAMNIPGTVYSCPLSCEKCICQRSSSPGDACTVFITSGSPPLRVPLFMMATRGRMA